jgi:DNA-binding MarR family transcriptional regulator
MSRQPPTAFNLNEFLPYRLSVVTNRISRALAGIYSERFNLTIPEWRVMAVLGQHKGLSADQVCARTEMDKVSVSRAVTRLIEKGWLARGYSPDDQRRSELELTRRGHAVYAQIVPLALRYQADLLGRLAPADQRRLGVLLGKLLQATDQIECGPGTQ